MNWSQSSVSRSPRVKAPINPCFATISKIGMTHKPDLDWPGYEIVVPRAELETQIEAAGLQLRFDYQGRELTTIPILDGGLYLHSKTTQILPETSRHRTVSIKAKRYDSKKHGSDVKVWYSWLTECPEEQDKIRGQHCLLIDDVFDSGETIAKVIDAIGQFGPASIKTMFLVCKDVTRTIAVVPDYVLFRTEDLWLVGAGMDDDGIMRDLRRIVCKSPLPKKG